MLSTSASAYARTSVSDLPIFLTASQMFSRTLPHARPCLRMSFSVLKTFFFVLRLTVSFDRNASISRVVNSLTCRVPKNGNKWFVRWPRMFKTVDGFISGNAWSLHSWASAWKVLFDSDYPCVAPAFLVKAFAHVRTSNLSTPIRPSQAAGALAKLPRTCTRERVSESS
jgi:hypothetical protein